MNVLLLSGGLDSSTLLHCLPFDACLTVNYGQMAVSQEIAYSHAQCEKKGCKHVVVDLLEVRHVFRSRLTSNASGNVVPGRNLLLVAIAAAYVASRSKHGVIYLGCNADDADEFRDCREAFFQAMPAVLDAGVDSRIRIKVPFVGLTKRHIWGLASHMALSSADFWTCYESGPSPCGHCASCIKFNRAIE